MLLYFALLLCLAIAPHCFIFQKSEIGLFVIEQYRLNHIHTIKLQIEIKCTYFVTIIHQAINIKTPSN